MVKFYVYEDVKTLLRLLPADAPYAQGTHIRTARWEDLGKLSDLPL